MRRKTFEVSVDLIVDFAHAMDENDLDNVIEGVTEDGDIEISVDFNPNQKEVIEQLHYMIDNYNDQNEEQNEDEEEENEV